MTNCLRFSPYNPWWSLWTGEPISHGQSRRCQGWNDQGQVIKPLSSWKNWCGRFGIHALLASNTVSNDYYPELARQLLNWVRSRREKTGVHLGFINLSGGVGVNYKARAREPNDITCHYWGRRAPQFWFDLKPAGLGHVKIYTELGRFRCWLHNGLLVTKVDA